MMAMHVILRDHEQPTAESVSLKIQTDFCMAMHEKAAP
jgi:hypothetical protein